MEVGMEVHHLGPDSSSGRIFEVESAMIHFRVRIVVVGVDEICPESFFLLPLLPLLSQASSSMTSSSLARRARSKALCPVMISRSITPYPNTSVFSEDLPVERYSGAMCPIVPRTATTKVGRTKKNAFNKPEEEEGVGENGGGGETGGARNPGLLWKLKCRSLAIKNYELKTSEIERGKEFARQT
nr:hypothetical protein TEA_018319 [Ipomoea batatas]